MIISCEQCLKKFEIKSDLIGDNGRLLQCGSCNHKWFFKKDDDKKSSISSNIIIEKKEIKNTDNNQIDKTVFNENFEIDSNKEEIDIPIKNNAIEERKKIKKNNFNFFKILLVIIISVISIIILIDTFKEPISFFIPNINLIMLNLYETILDIFLFFQDLI
jgi:predicted Zn finger-like uncharacterized protein